MQFDYNKYKGTPHFEAQREKGFLKGKPMRKGDRVMASWGDGPGRWRGVILGLGVSKNSFKIKYDDGGTWDEVPAKECYALIAGVNDTQG
jgi:hypothetical protein